MVKLFSAEHTFQHPFSRVTSAFMNKYPNAAAPHVKAIDITDRRIDEQGRLITNRLISCHSALPSWLRSAGMPQTCYVAESAVVDPNSHTMVVKSSNLSGSSIMVIEETCTYSQCPTAPTTATHYRQEARITAFLPLISSKFENYSFANFQSKSADGLIVVERLCQKIAQHGVLALFKDHLPQVAMGAMASSSSAMASSPASYSIMSAAAAVASKSSSSSSLSSSSSSSSSSASR
jgi:hypothetical protein